MNRVGHSFIKKTMRERDGVFGGEVTGHYYFRDNFYADNGFIPALMLLELMSAKGQSLAELLAPLKAKYFISGEINTKVASMDLVQAKLDGLAKHYADGTVTSLDGVSVEYPGLALQRPAVEHRATVATESGSDDDSPDGRETG